MQGGHKGEGGGAVPDYKYVNKKLESEFLTSLAEYSQSCECLGCCLVTEHSTMKSSTLFKWRLATTFYFNSPLASKSHPWWEKVERALGWSQDWTLSGLLRSSWVGSCPRLGQSGIPRTISSRSRWYLGDLLAWDVIHPNSMTGTSLLKMCCNISLWSSVKRLQSLSNYIP